MKNNKFLKFFFTYISIPLIVSTLGIGGYIVYKYESHLYALLHGFFGSIIVWLNYVMMDHFKILDNE